MMIIIIILYILTHFYFKIIFYIISGSYVRKIGETILVSKQVPLLMYAGEVMSAISGGQLAQLQLTTHDALQSGLMERDQTTLEENFNKQLNLQR